MNVIGTDSFKEYAEKNQSEMWHSLISSVHRPSQASPLAKPDKDRDFSELFNKDYQKLNVPQLRRMVGWTAQQSIGKFCYILIVQLFV